MKLKWNILKPNKWNLPLTVLYIVFSWIPIFKIPVWCVMAPCPPEQVSFAYYFFLHFLKLDGGFWLLNVILFYIIVSFIYAKLKK